MSHASIYSLVCFEINSNAARLCRWAKRDALLNLDGLAEETMVS